MNRYQMINSTLLLSIVLIIIIKTDQSSVMPCDALKGVAITELSLLKNKLEMIRKLALLFEGTS